jgi:hypothetical protein
MVKTYEYHEGKEATKRFERRVPQSLALSVSLFTQGGAPSFRAFGFCGRVGSTGSVPRAARFSSSLELGGFTNEDAGIIESHPSS